LFCSDWFFGILNENVDPLPISLSAHILPRWFSIIPLDMARPKKDGLTVVREIIQYDPDAKIILITASDDQKIIQQCLDSGASSYISKPFDFNAVLKGISDILAK